MKKINKKLLVVKLLLLITFIFFIVFMYHVNKKNYKEDNTDQIERIEEIDNQKAVDDLVNDGMYNIIMNGSIECESSVCNVNIKNPEHNKYKSKFTLVVDDKKVYESEWIKTGYELKTIKLNNKLESGRYEAKSIITVDVKNEKRNINIDCELFVK